MSSSSLSLFSPESVHVGTPPQSEAETGPVLEVLRRLDPLVDFRWNAAAVLEKPGHFDASGRRVGATYGGRWQVIRYNTDRLHQEREYAVILTVTQIRQEGKVPVMLDKGPYAPIGFWLVDYMQLWDRAQGRLAEEMMKELWKEHEQAEQPDDTRAANQEALEKVYRDHGGLYWMGGAQGTADPETARTLWGAATPAPK